MDIVAGEQAEGGAVHAQSQGGQADEGEQPVGNGHYHGKEVIEQQRGENDAPAPVGHAALGEKLGEMLHDAVRLLGKEKAGCKAQQNDAGKRPAGGEDRAAELLTEKGDAVAVGLF